MGTDIRFGRGLRRSGPPCGNLVARILAQRSETAFARQGAPRSGGRTAVDKVGGGGIEFEPFENSDASVEAGPAALRTGR